MAWQNRTVAASANTAYVLVFKDGNGNQTPINIAAFASTSTGDFLVRLRKNNSGLTQGVNGNITTSPLTPPVTADWFHVGPGQGPTVGADRSTPDAPHDLITEIDIWCTTGGELVVLGH